MLAVAEPTINHAVLVGVNDVPFEAFDVVFEALPSIVDVTVFACRRRYIQAKKRDMYERECVWF